MYYYTYLLANILEVHEHIDVTTLNLNPGGFFGFSSPLFLFRALQILVKYMKCCLIFLVPTHVLSAFLIYIEERYLFYIFFYSAGYHAFPSMDRLHLHVLSTDFCGEYMTKPYQWNSFHTEFFVPTHSKYKNYVLYTQPYN